MYSCAPRSHGCIAQNCGRLAARGGPWWQPRDTPLVMPVMWHTVVRVSQTHGTVHYCALAMPLQAVRGALKGARHAVSSHARRTPVLWVPSLGPQVSLRPRSPGACLPLSAQSANHMQQNVLSNAPQPSPYPVARIGCLPQPVSTPNKRSTGSRTTRPASSIYGSLATTYPLRPGSGLQRPAPAHPRASRVGVCRR